MICRKCGIKISNDSKFCYSCGNATSNLGSNTINTANKNICSNCGNKVSNGSSFCQKCGHKLVGKSSVTVHNNVLGNNTVSDDLTLTTAENSTASNTLNINTTQNSNESNALSISTIGHDMQNDCIVQSNSIPNNTLAQQNNYTKTMQIQLEKEKNKNKIYFVIIIGCAVIIFLIIMLAIADSANDITSNNNINNDTNTSTNNNDSSNNAITDNNETSQTKTYTNTEENISFNYPKDWEDTTSTTDDLALIVNLSSPKHNNFSTNMSISKLDINLTSELLNKNSVDYKSLINEIYGQKGIEVEEISDTKVDNVDALKILSVVLDNGTSVQYIYNANNAIYAITFTTLTEDLDKYEPIFDSIVASYSITGNTQSTLQEQISENNGLTGEQALKVAQEFADTHPLYDRTITDHVEYEPSDYPYSTKGLYLVRTMAPDGSYRSMWVDKNTGSILLSTDGLTLIDAEEAYEELFMSNEDNAVILFEEKNIIDYLGSSIDYVYDDFGTNKYGTNINGSLHEDSEYIGYDSIAFVYDDESYIDSILGDTTMLTYNGETLNKSRNELVKLLGEPDFEDLSYNNNYKKYIHWMEYVYGDYIFRFDFEEGTAFLLTIY